MNKINRILSVAVAASFMVLLAANLYASDTAKLSVDGMTCSGCVKSVKSALEKVDGVESAQVDLKSNSAVVAFNPEKTTLESMEKAVADAGYSAKPQSEEQTEKAMKKSTDSNTMEKMEPDQAD